MDEYIHCNLMEARGPIWKNLSKAKVRKLIKEIHEGTNLMGQPPDMYGFVGTRLERNLSSSEIVGGYFAVQYAGKEFIYDKKKNLDVIDVAPFARMFFVFFARSGLCLLQNTRFTGIPLTYTEAKLRFQFALNRVFEKCKIGELEKLVFARTERTNSDFKAHMRRSTRVSRVKVANPARRSVSRRIKYYNPRVDRNEIIRLSHQHDYDYLESIELEVKENADIRDLHLKDVMQTGQTEEMDYYTRGEKKVTLRRKIINKFTFNVDMDAEELLQEQFTSVLQQMRESGTLA